MTFALADPASTHPAPTRPERTRRAGSSWRAVVGLLVLVLTLLGGTAASLTATAAPAHAVPPTEITLEDTAGVIYEPQLREEVQRIDFYEPTHVVVFTQRGTGDSNFNERVLAYARENRPEWISADGQKWADGLFILGIDPDGRHVGTYFGEDRKVSTDLQGDIQESTHGLLRDAQWTDAAVQGVESAAGLMNRPWYRHPWVWILTGLGVLMVGGTAVGVANDRRTKRRRAQADLERGRTAFSSVTMDLDATELNARTVPEDSRYGAQVLERHRTFHDRYVRLAEQNDRLAGLDAKVLHQKEHLTAAREFADEAQALDQLDDVVAHSNTFLNRQSGWEAGWDAQTAPLRADLERIAARDVGAAQDSMPDDLAWAPLESFRIEAEGELDRLGGQLQTQQISPDDALDRLAALRERLSGLLDRHATAVAGRFAKTSKERSTMDREFERARRAEARTYQGSILDSVYSPGHFWTVVAFSRGYSSGQSSVESARAAASSSSTGYGSSGGSFSGAGSSSRF